MGMGRPMWCGGIGPMESWQPGCCRGSAIASSGFFDGVPLEWGMAQLGDVDGNGTADVIWRHSISGAVAVWMMNGLSISSVEFPGSLSTDWVLAGR